MNMIAIDSVTPVLSVTAKGKSGSATVSLASATQHAETITDVLEQTMKHAGFTPLETELVICAEGPGSFTGLRLAYATAKAIQLASGCTLVPIPPLLCYAHETASWPGAVISVLDAKKQRYYVQLFRRGNQITGALDLSVDEVLRFIDPDERILIVGPDARLFAEEMRLALPTVDLTSFPTGTHGISTVLISIAESSLGVYTDTISDYSGPIYVRKSDAETNSKR